MEGVQCLNEFYTHSGGYFDCAECCQTADHTASCHTFSFYETLGVNSVFDDETMLVYNNQAPSMVAGDEKELVFL